MSINVKVTYKDRDLKPTSEFVYPLREYTDMLSHDLKRIITDIEDMAYIMCGNKSKSNWTEAEIAVFNRIKHKLLDKAGEIGRLPDNLIESALPLNR